MTDGAESCWDSQNKHTNCSSVHLHQPCSPLGVIRARERSNQSTLCVFCSHSRCSTLIAEAKCISSLLMKPCRSGLLWQVTTDSLCTFFLWPMTQIQTLFANKSHDFPHFTHFYSLPQVWRVTSLLDTSHPNSPVRDSSFNLSDKHKKYVKLNWHPTFLLWY